MLLVLAMSIVLSIIGLPVHGSFSFGNVTRTSVISFPRSPHPMYITTLAALHFARLWRVTVFPLPKGPGIAAVPPFAIGNMVSITRHPVISGSAGSNFSLMGLGLRTGHLWYILSSTSPLPGTSTVAMVSSTVYSPSLATHFRTPCTSGGTSTLWVISGVSGTSPSISPPETLSPGFTPLGLKCHFLLRSSAGTFIPRLMKMLFATSLIASSGLWIPSYILPIRPGPSSTLRGAPVPYTGSPGLRPVVDSYTCI